MGSVVLMASVALASTGWSAEQFHRGTMGGRHPVVARPIVPPGSFGHPRGPRPFVRPPFPRPIFPRPFVHHRFGHHRFGHHGFVPFGVFGGSVVAYAAPVVPYAAAPAYYGDGSAYYDSPAAYDSPAVYNPAVAAPGSVAVSPAPIPNVIQYATGRYELRGDGLTVPYTWVWIPNPPPGPPSSAAPVGPTLSGDSPAPSRAQLYRWTDSNGALHMTDRWESVPPPYRNQPS